MKKSKTARKEKTALKEKKLYVYAILKKKKSFYLFDDRYDEDIPKVVDKKTAKLLRKTKLFEFERIIDENKGSDKERQEENKESTEESQD